jgi:hypothetical protein
MPNVWEVIRDYPWNGAPASKDLCEKYIELLNTHNPVKVLELYSSSAVHITSARTIQGWTNLHTWYTSLFQQLPDAKFTLTGFTGSGNSRHMTWTATSTTGSVHNGSDSFGLFEDGKINYHYSFFTVS